MSCHVYSDKYISYTSIVPSSVYAYTLSINIFIYFRVCLLVSLVVG